MIFSKENIVLTESAEYKTFKRSVNIKTYNDTYNEADSLARNKKYKEAIRMYKKCYPILEKIKKEAEKLEKDKDKKQGLNFYELLVGVVDDSIDGVNKQIERDRKKATKESAMLEEACAKFLEENFSVILAENDFIISITEK